ncbi:hypothetical protein HMPREF1549_03241 [Actinomyces johnsonii F0510]|uniref:Uncharacterized protein n=1 Tax=Actinomyces johnsonii F0510 TaxID=1227262 RepID=U1PZY5_9ACTO|nr:hypothetical protein HMPREF1549_03241 [Actinomyces johnsonii F0510]
MPYAIEQNRVEKERLANHRTTVMIGHKASAMIHSITTKPCRPSTYRKPSIIA